MITSQDLLARLNRISPQLTQLKNVVYFRDKLNPDDPKAQSIVNDLTSKQFNVTTLDQVYQIGEKIPPLEFPKANPNDVTLIMYTRSVYMISCTYTCIQTFLY